MSLHTPLVEVLHGHFRGPQERFQGSPGKLVGDNRLESGDNDEVAGMFVVGKSLLPRELPGFVTGSLQ